MASEAPRGGDAVTQTASPLPLLPAPQMPDIQLRNALVVRMALEGRTAWGAYRVTFDARSLEPCSECP